MTGPDRMKDVLKPVRKRGLLLPNLDGVDTVEEQIAIARQKAGIGPVEVTSMSWVPMDTASSMSDSLPREEGG